MPRLETGFLILALLIPVGLVLQGRLIANYSYEALLFPTIVTVVMVLSVGVRLLQLRDHARAKAEEAGTESEAPEADAGYDIDFPSLLRAAGWTVAVLAFIWVFGFQVGLPLYVLGFLLFFRINILLALGLSAVSAVFIFLVFVEMLGVRLPGGLLW